MASTFQIPASNQGLASIFWPDTVTKEGEVNGDGLVRRIETVFGLMAPAMAGTYLIPKYCCDCSNSGYFAFACTLVPYLFSTVDECRAKSEAERIQALKEKTKPPEQILRPGAPKDPRREEIEKNLLKQFEVKAELSSSATPTDLTETRSPNPAVLTSINPASLTPNTRQRKAPIKASSGVESVKKTRRNPLKGRETKPPLDANGYPSELYLVKSGLNSHSSHAEALEEFQ